MILIKLAPRASYTRIGDALIAQKGFGPLTDLALKLLVAPHRKMQDLDIVEGLSGYNASCMANSMVSIIYADLTKATMADFGRQRAAKAIQ
jgi:hypothetical protein